MREEHRDRELSTADLAARTPDADGRTQDDERFSDRAVERGRETTGPADLATDRATPLLARDAADDLQMRWGDIQAGFVDEPRRAVEQADSLVAEAIKRLAETFADERAQLESQWDRGDDVSTEDLRQALQRYRSFFTRLLEV